MYDVCNNSPMACRVVALVAHEASAALSDVPQSALQIGLRALGLHMAAESARKASEVSRPSRFSALLGIAQPAQVNVLDSGVSKRLRQRLFGETLSPRDWQLTDVDKATDACILKRRDEIDEVR